MWINVAMDDFKLRDFAASEGKQLPVQKCSEKEVATVRALLLRRLGLPEATDGLALVQAVEARSVAVEALDASRDDFDLAQFFAESIGISLEDYVFLNWYRFDELDRMRARDLAEFFSDVWYPSADDLDVMDRQCRWIISIDHHGGLRVLQLAPGTDDDDVNAGGRSTDGDV